MNKNWDTIINEESKKEYFVNLQSFLEKEYSNYDVYPKKEEIYTALNLTSLENTKIIIIGQDPYHGKNQAHGLAFSVKPENRIPPSLLNIYKELSSAIGISIPKTGNLIPWAKQGVLLLNTVLTVRASEPYSHRKKGWEIFTDKLISELNKTESPKVFILWGKPAQEKEKLITNKNHLILKAAHPSPLSASRGFIGCKHFSKANDFLEKNHLKIIDWKLEKEG